MKQCLDSVEEAILENSGDCMEVDLSEGSCGSVSSASRCSSPVSSRRSQSSDGSTDCSDRDQLRFSPEEYLQMHKRALIERARFGTSGPRMKVLYSYWCEFLLDNFNDAMYRSFLKLAQEDSVHGHIYGLRCLFKFFKKRLAFQFDKEHFAEFEDLAHRYHDYLDFDYGLRCLVELLTMGTAETAAAAGCTLNPLTTALLEAWQQYIHASSSQADAASMCETPRVKLHQQLAEKRKKRSKARKGLEGGSEPPQVAKEAEVQSAAVSRQHKERAEKVSAPQQRYLASAHKKVALRAKAQPWLPQAKVRVSSHPEAQRLPERLGELLGN